MQHYQIRQKFLAFFSKRAHKVLDSFPLRLQDDPSLLFVNAGMNPFKDYFLGHKKPQYKRIVNIQRCLRVSGKHNDLEEVGDDETHLTFFEMMGNWSFGDYFKEEAIQWAFEFLTNPLQKGGLGLPTHALYVTYFGGAQGLSPDKETKNIWKKYLPESKIHPKDMDDNFWEMGATGPCGPCTEIYYNLHSGEAVEVWNLVFMSYNRLPDGSLEELPTKHVDTGMGLERLAMVMKDHKARTQLNVRATDAPISPKAKRPLDGGSVYDTDILHPIVRELIRHVSEKNKEATEAETKAVYISVDHLRAAAAAIAEGVQPANTGAGYVIRRLIRRALRYGYEYLNLKEPYLCALLTAFQKTMRYQAPDKSPSTQQTWFPALTDSEVPIYAMIKGEEEAFLRTLSKGLRRMEMLCSSAKGGIITGEEAFRLYDTYGFPLDLTRVMAHERGLKVDEAAYATELARQKERSRAASSFVAEVAISTKTKGSTFVGYELDDTPITATIVSAQPMDIKGKKYGGLVLDKTPFYAESGGQVGDTGIIGIPDIKHPIPHDFEAEDTETHIKVLNTRKIHGQIVHEVDWDSYQRMMANKRSVEKDVLPVVNRARRAAIAAHHTATHLVHAALREVLHAGVEQRGSFVAEEQLRFDFSYEKAIPPEAIQEIEKNVNDKIRANSAREIKHMTLNEAKKLGAMALFGEKYGEEVRVVIFDRSIELCGGTHVAHTGVIGCFKIKGTRALSAGVRRIEAVAGHAAWNYIACQLDELHSLRNLLKQPPDAPKALERLLEANAQTNKQLAAYAQEKEQKLQAELQTQIKSIEKKKLSFLCAHLPNVSLQALKSIGMGLARRTPRLVAVLVSEDTSLNKAHLVVLVDKTIAGQNNIPSAHQWCQSLAQHIKGRGGGQSFLATAGGTYPKGIHTLLNEVRAWTKNP